MQLDLLTYRATDPDTSITAGTGDRTTDRDRALAILRDHPDGLTDHELATLMGRAQTSAGKRRLECQRLGLVEDSGTTRPSPWGSPCIVWRAI